MTSTSITAPAPLGAVERRLEKIHMQPVTAVAIVAALIVLVGDSQSLALIPLVGAMTAEYHLTAAQSPLVLSILSIVGAGAVPVLTRVAERISLRGFLIIGLAIATVGNLLCAVAPGFTLLLIGRLVLGLSAAAPISIALMREKSRDVHGTNRGMGLITAAIGLGVAISFLMGGTVLQLNGSVSVVFWIMALLAAISLVGAWILVPDFKLKAKQHIDYAGAVLLIIGLTAIAVGISYGADWGWVSAETLGVLIGGVVVMALWVWVELTVKEPLIDLRITFKQTTVPAYVSAGLYSALAIMSNLAVTTFAQIPAEALKPFGPLAYGLTDWGHSVLESAMFLMPTAFFVLFGGFIMGPIMTRLGLKQTMISGGLLTIIGFAFLAIWHSTWWENMLGMAIWGFAFALGYSAANAAYLHAAKDKEASLFSAAGTMVFASIGSFGAVVFSAVLAGNLLIHQLPAATAAAALKASPALATLPSAGAFTWAWIVCAIGGGILLVLAFVHKNSEYQGGLTEELLLTSSEVTGAPEKNAVIDD